MSQPHEPVVAGPLGGLRVVVTRPRAQAAALVDALEAVGATPVPVPVIEIVDPPDGGVGLRTALRVLRAGDWVAITSPNGAAKVAEALGDRPLAEGVQVAVVGPGTRDRAEALGLTVDLVPADAIAEGLAAAFPAPPTGGGRVVLARAEVARETLPIHLRMMGWNVDEVVAYRTVTAPVDDAGRAACAAADAVVFTSGSTVSSLVDAVGLEGLPPRVASIGPATSAVAAERDVIVDVEADPHTIPGVVEALVTHLADTPVLHRESAASADAQWCLEQYYAELDERFAHGLDRDAVQSTDVDEISPPNGLMVVIRLDGRPVGCGCLKISDPDVIDVKRMWLSAEVRGRGLGRGLLRHLIDEARSLGFGRVRLDTNESLTEAIALYEKTGFVAVDRFNDDPHATHFFELELD
ncbi:MAG: GNAT family N-acetyltransferase [Actinomycetota bacterium]